MRQGPPMSERPTYTEHRGRTIMVHPGNAKAHVSPGIWDGTLVAVEGYGPCPIDGHDLHRWIRTDGYDTGFLWCDGCMGVADCPGAFDCGEEGPDGASWCGRTPDHSGEHRFVRGFDGDDSDA